MSKRQRDRLFLEVLKHQEDRKRREFFEKHRENASLQQNPQLG